MKARPVINTHIEIGEDAFANVRIWTVPQPVRGSAHGYKSALAYVVAGECVLRYDNEASKGDHRHWGAEESGYDFSGTDALLNDFYADIARWNDENGLV